MQYTKHWDFQTLLLYLFLAILFALFYKKAIICKKKKLTINVFGLILNQKYLWYGLIYILFILFSCFRYVAPGIGGTDTLVYMEHFKNITYVPLKIKELILFSGFEYLFFNLMYFIKILGGNYFYFSLIIYSIIILCNIFVVDKSINDEKKWTWLILWFLPLLKSINIVRNCVAAAFGIIAIDYLNNNNYRKFLLFAILAFLNHYIAIILLIFGLFYRLIPDKVINNRKICLLGFGISLILTIIFLPIVKYLISITGFSGYLDKIEISLIGYLPILFLYGCLLFDNQKIIDYLKKIKHYAYYKMMIFLSLILPIFIMLNGASRILLFFEIPRYILYADLYCFYRQKINKNKRVFYDGIIICSIICWLIFRIWRMWEGYSLMPYINVLFE